MGELVYQRLSTVGDGSGTINMNVNGATTPVTFKIAPAEGDTLRVARVMIYVEDNGTFDSDKWGNGVVLANGFNFKHKKGDVTTDLLAFGITSSGEMASICHDIDHRSFGTGNEFVSFRWTFTKAGATLDLDGNSGDELQVVVNDDMTDLVKMYVMAQGEYL